jgi:tetratricopeptide (TPR) repeat protein
MTDAQALYARGQAALEAGDAHEAIECFTRAVALRPDVAAAFRGRATAYLQLNERHRALADLDRAVRLAPEDAQLLAERAAERLKQRDYPGTIADCDAALRLDPGRADVIAVRGHAYAKSGESEKALADFATAVTADPDAASIYLTARAKLWYDRGDPAAAEADADQALRSDPGHLPAVELRALCRQDLGKLDEAEDDFRIACAAESPSVVALLGAAQLAFWRKRYAEAEERAGRTLDRFPNLPAAKELRARVRQHLGDLTGALADLTELLETQPDRATARLARAEVSAAAGDAAAAVRDYLTVLDKHPDSAPAYNNLAWLWATDPTVRNGVQAKVFATRACELTEWANADFLDTLAAACDACGEPAEAAAWRAKATASPER